MQNSRSTDSYNGCNVRILKFPNNLELIPINSNENLLSYDYIINM